MVALLTIGCKSEQEKALDAIKDSANLGSLREFEAAFPEMEPSVKKCF